ncbi:hypothetical protein C0V82_14155 [Niveispirillum cyanobacteriorum]|uniref:DUF3486 family protein n=2 Tax=Niveispirillum cyanobacteriorum TaxID=1612173 RepID=A0A2K9NDU1_9PROT|nr:hypothetical protein C0V82_14155 [Niveispirillum cyanobacteriorum]
MQPRVWRRSPVSAALRHGDAMARPSSIDKLPQEVQEEIGRLRGNGRTIDEILNKLRELDVDVSRSALGRHVQNLDQVAERLRRTRSISEGLIGKLGDQAGSKLAQLNIELMQNAVFELTVDPETGDTVQMDAKAANFLAGALHKLSAAAKTDMDLRVAIRKEVEAEMEKAKRAQADAAAEAAAQRGMTDDDVAFLRAQILGIKMDGRAA